MEIKEIFSHKELLEKVKENASVFLLLYKEGSETSNCAVENLEKTNSQKEDLIVLKADVSKVMDIHKNYYVNSVPTLLSFSDNKFINTVKGCNQSSYYKSFFEDSLFLASPADGGEKKQASVTVYSTPTCSWCTRLKNYLKENNIRFRDIDVSKDQKAAEAMVKRSGQQGVPQSLINGQVIVGFDKNKIDKLLGIN